MHIFIYLVYTTVYVYMHVHQLNCAGMYVYMQLKNRVQTSFWHACQLRKQHMPDDVTALVNYSLIFRSDCDSSVSLLSPASWRNIQFASLSTLSGATRVHTVADAIATRSRRPRRAPITLALQSAHTLHCETDCGMLGRIC